MMRCVQPQKGLEPPETHPPRRRRHMCSAPLLRTQQTEGRRGRTAHQPISPGKRGAELSRRREEGDTRQLVWKLFQEAGIRKASLPLEGNIENRHRVRGTKHLKAQRVNRSCPPEDASDACRSSAQELVNPKKNKKNPKNQSVSLSPPPQRSNISSRDCDFQPRGPEVDRETFLDVEARTRRSPFSNSPISLSEDDSNRRDSRLASLVSRRRTTSMARGGTLPAAR
jgi:hypothetical protein